MSHSAAQASQASFAAHARRRRPKLRGAGACCSPNPLPSLSHVAQLAAVELLPNFLAAHPAVRLVVIDSVTFHFRQVGCGGPRPLLDSLPEALRPRETPMQPQCSALPTSPACTAEPAWWVLHFPSA